MPRIFRLLRSATPVTRQLDGCLQILTTIMSPGPVQVAITEPKQLVNREIILLPAGSVTSVILQTTGIL